jgi:hypothetical protein
MGLSPFLVVVICRLQVWKEQTPLSLSALPSEPSPARWTPQLGVFLCSTLATVLDKPGKIGTTKLCYEHLPARPRRAHRLSAAFSS